MEKTLLKNLLAVTQRHRIKYLKATLLLLAANLFFIFNPLILRQAIYATGHDSSNPPHPIVHFLLGSWAADLFTWIAILVTITLISCYLKYRMRVDFVSISRDVEEEIRQQLFKKLQKQSAAFYDRYEVGELLSRLTNDVTVYRDILGPGIMYPLMFLTMIIPGLAALFYISQELAYVSFIPIILIPLLNISFRRWIYHLSKSVQKMLGRMSALTQEHYTSIRLIRSYVVEGAMERLFSKISRTFNHSSTILNTIQSMLYPFYALLTKLVTTTLVFMAGVIILEGWALLEPADFVSFMWIQSYIYIPVLMMAWMLPIYERGRAAYDRIFEIYDAPIEVKNGAESHLRIPINADITIKNLTFTYPMGKEPALNHLSCHFPSSSFIGITGTIGAGKTTLFRLLSREYEVPSRTIFIGGRDIHEYPLAAFSEAMVSVEQVPFLFSRTIAENVAFGRPEAKQEEIEEVSDYADLHNTIMEFPESYRTVVGERGVTLSGGQKQRVAMARAFLVDRSILLLDDIFSAIDFQTEKMIYEKMRKNFAGKLVLLVTQRVSILNQMDQLFLFDEGKIVESGSPDELKKRGGAYQALVKMQTYKLGEV